MRNLHKIVHLLYKKKSRSDSSSLYKRRAKFGGNEKVPKSSDHTQPTPSKFQEYHFNMQTAPKLTKNSPAMLLLRRKLDSGEINLSESPKRVWESEPIFRRHKLATFRAQFNRMKKDYNDNESGFEFNFSIFWFY